MNRLIRFYNELSIWPKIFIGSLFTSFPIYFAAFLSHSYSKTAGLDQPYSLLSHIAFFIGFLTLIIFSIRILSFYNDQFLNDLEEEKSCIRHAFTLCERIIVSNNKELEKIDEKNFHNSIFFTSIQQIEKIIEAAYNTFESSYGSTFYDEKRIEFEVTFMTKSYIDNLITIPCSANRDGRSPRSMILRKKNPNIYNCTETEMIYREQKPSIRIIENTCDSKYNYNELYDKQKNRIKSSIIYPVLSPKNELLGTIVVHCDKNGFFKNEKEKFWIELLEIFSKRIAIEKMKMDFLFNLTAQGEISLKIPKKIFF